MYGSQRFWTTAAVGGLLVSVAVLLERPALLLGAAGIGAWLVASQLVAVHYFTDDADLEVNYAVDKRSVAVDQPLRCRLTVDRATPTPTTITVTAPLPLAARGADNDARTVTLDPFQRRAATTFELTFPVAGRVDLDSPTVELTDGVGLFTETISRGPSPQVDVTTNAPRDLHIGRGGERSIAAYGDHVTDRRGPGLQPEELREYVTGDPADSIDWKATARLNETYVREYQAETDRETIILLDHRDAMAHGPGGETMLAYAREVALAIAQSAITASDPLGLYAIGDDGLTTRIPPTTLPNGHTKIRTTIQTLDTTTPTKTAAPASRPGRAHHAHTRLENDDSAFATKLRPFLDAGDAYVQRLAGDPLFGAVEALVADADSNQVTIIITSDADPPRVREATKLAASRSATVFVFLTPAVLFDSELRVETAYERYVQFEDLRRDLDRIPRVAAFEVGPGDRLQRLLATRRARTTET